MRFLIVILLSFVTTLASANDFIKAPNVAGAFYSNDSKELTHQLNNFFDYADVEFDDEARLLILPHAGYRYSGQVAAHGYKQVSRQHIKTIILISPSHYFNFEGVSIWKKGLFQTPLGNIRVNEKLANKFLINDSIFSFQRDVYEKEHGLEVHLPFIQYTFPDATIVPMIFGAPNPQVSRAVANQLKKAIGDRDDILIIVSADFSHYHPYDKAVQLDQHAINAVIDFDVEKIWRENMARTMELDAMQAVVAALLYAQDQQMLDVTLLKYANSGDVTDDKSRVVGYAALAFKKQQVAPLSDEQKKWLLKMARDTIDHYVKTGDVLNSVPTDPRLMSREGAFVTLHKAGQLRGCIGHIVGHQPLYQTVRDVAIAAATQDPRFSPVTIGELGDIDVEVSVLSEPKRVSNVNDIEMGTHGVILSQGNKRGVFLPQVATETGWNRDEFLSQLSSQKAGLPRDAWKDKATTLEIFAANIFGEK